MPVVTMQDDMILQAATAVEQLMFLAALAAQTEADADTERASDLSVSDETEPMTIRSAQEVHVEGASIYPVPASEWLRVESPGGAMLKSARVLDLAGGVVPAPVIRTGEHGLQLSVGALPTGSYLLEVLDGTGAVRRTFTVAR